MEAGVALDELPQRVLEVPDDVFVGIGTEVIALEIGKPSLDREIAGFRLISNPDRRDVRPGYSS